MTKPMKYMHLCVFSLLLASASSAQDVEVYKCKNPDGTTTMSFGMPCKNGGGEMACDKPEQYYLQKKSVGAGITEDSVCLAKLGLLKRHNDEESARITEANEEKRKIAEAKAAGLFIVDYEVIGPERVSLTYTNQGGSTEQRDVNPPWRLRLTEPKGFHAYISAQNKSNDLSVIVSLYVNGIQVKTSHSTSKYGIATASGRL